MKEQLITFETAKLAKEKGFNELVKTLYISDNDVVKSAKANNSGRTNSNYIEREDYKVYSAPTQSLLQKWLREEHNIHIDLTTDLYDDLETMCFRGFAILKMKKFKNPLYESYDVFKTYEEALEVGLQEALKLI